jgi:hypothetical protein
MSAEDKLGTGMLLFLVFFVLALLLIPRGVYREHLASLSTRGGGRVASVGAVSVFALAVPYFYDMLVGFDHRGVARLIQILISVAAYVVLIDLVHFIYKNYWATFLARRRRK